MNINDKRQWEAKELEIKKLIYINQDWLYSWRIGIIVTFYINYPLISNNLHNIRSIWRKCLKELDGAFKLRLIYIHKPYCKMLV